MSGPYLHGHHASVLRSHSWRTVENSCPHLLPFLNKPSLKILDVGCGPGTISVDLAARVPQGFVYAIDPSANVIEKARKHAEEMGIKNIRFEVGDIFEWNKLEGVEEQGFDVVHAHQVLQHLQDPLGAMKEMKRLAKTGGILAIRDCNYGAMDWYPDHPMLHKWKKLYIKVALGLKAHPNIGKQLHAIAMEAGFPRSDIEASVAAWTFSTPEEREFWCGLWADRTVQSDYKKRALDSGHATEQDLEEISAAFREMEKKEDGWLVVINGQIICHVSFLILPWLPGPADVRYINPTLPLQPEPSTQTINPQPYEYQPFISPTYRTNLSEINMQSVTVLVNSEHTSCPKCGAGISDGTKSCGSCGSTCPA